MDAAGMYELLAKLTCPLCGGTRGTSVLAVLDGQAGEGFTMVRAQCVRCHLFWSFPLGWLAGDGEGVQPQLAEADPISMDEVLDVHLLLRRFDGLLTELIG